MYVDSFYRKIIQSSDKTVATGYNYGVNGLIDKFVSPRLYLVPRIEGFLNLLDPALVELLESVKRLQFYYNYTIDKNDRRINS